MYNKSIMVAIDEPIRIKIATELVYRLFRLTEMSFSITNVNYPLQENKVIFAMWHAQQCCLHGIPKEKKKNVNILISRSGDGEIIARVTQRWGFSNIRGSQDKGTRKKGGVQATMGMIDALNKGQNVAIMVDGPVGPYHEVKNGVIRVAKHTGAMIIPMIWYTPQKTMLKLPTWDKFEIPAPFCFTKAINLYGEPIYVENNPDSSYDKQKRLELKQALLDLEKIAPEKYKEVYCKK